MSIAQQIRIEVLEQRVATLEKSLIELAAIVAGQKSNNIVPKTLTLPEKRKSA